MYISDLIIKILEFHKIKNIFGYPGSAIAPLYNSLRLSKKIKNILVRHESNAAFAAIGYSKVSNKIPVILVTPGPGIANIISGISTAYLDSVPLLILTSRSHDIDEYKYKCINFLESTKCFIKASFSVKNIKELIYSFNIAFNLIKKDRRGPIYIEIDEKFLYEILNYKEFKYLFNIYKLNFFKKILSSYKIKVSILQINKVQYIAKQILNSKKPIILVGGGVIKNGAYILLRQIIKKYNIPVVNTMMSVCSIEKNDKNNFGLLGINGTKTSYDLVNDSDLLIIISCRCHPRTIGPLELFAKNAKIIRIDIDEYELFHNIHSDIILKMDSYIFLKNLIKFLPKNKIFYTRKENNISDCYKMYNSYSKKVDPQLFFKIMNEITGGNIIVTTGIGQCQIFATTLVKVNKPNYFLTSGGHAPMGFGLPSALGACIATKKRVVVIDGDGSFQMSLQELSLIKELKLPIVVFIFNNNCLGLIKELQKRSFQHKLFSVNMKNGNPKFENIANAYDIDYKIIKKNKDIKKVISEVFSVNKPYIVEVLISSKYDLRGKHIK